MRDLTRDDVMLAYTSNGWELHPSEDLALRYYQQGDIGPQSCEWAAAVRAFKQMLSRGVRAYNAAERARIAWKDAAELLRPTTPIDPAGVLIRAEEQHARQSA